MIGENNSADENIGKTFGSLSIIERVENKVNNLGKTRKRYKCLCDCGNEHLAVLTDLKQGKVKSCGCLRKSGLRKTHNLSKTKLYLVWKDMVRRCTNPKATGYKRYGGRGITVCEEWLGSVELFYNWAMVNGWEEGLQIDRKNGDIGYSPDNCRFVTCSQNIANSGGWRNSTSRYKGVSYNSASGKWVAVCKQKYLGAFDEEKDAALVYNQAAEGEFGEYAFLNDV